jgi:hypothetical protein
MGNGMWGFPSVSINAEGRAALPFWRARQIGCNRSLRPSTFMNFAAKSFYANSRVPKFITSSLKQM